MIWSQDKIAIITLSLQQLNITSKLTIDRKVKKHKYLQCSDNQRVLYNRELATTQPTNHTSSTDISNWILAAANEKMTKILNEKRPFELSSETLDNITTKSNMIAAGATDDEVKDIKKHIRKRIRSDKRKHVANMIGPDLDIRDQYMGLRNLRRPYVAIPLGMKDAAGKHVPLKQRAQKATEFLSKLIWGDTRKQEETLALQNVPPRQQIITDNLWMDIDVISMEELLWAIRKLKRNKAPGPDGVPTECYKDMHEDQLKLVLEMINNWWAGAPIATEATRAQVILLFKKGGQNDLSN